MEYGMIPYYGLKEEDFKLKASAQPYLSGIPNKKPEVIIGLSKWGVAPSISKQGLDPKPGTLKYYGERYECIELNATHYRTPDEATVRKWLRDVPPGFLFCPKFPKAITYGSLNSKHLVTESFVRTSEYFGDNLGCSFLQLPERQKADIEGLENYLKGLPKRLKVSVDVRNEQWFGQDASYSQLLSVLNNGKHGIVICDTPAFRLRVKTQQSNSTAFIRFNCMGDNQLDNFRIEEWVIQFRDLFAKGLKRCYFMLHIHKEHKQEAFYDRVKQKFTAENLVI